MDVATVRCKKVDFQCCETTKKKKNNTSGSAVDSSGQIKQCACVEKFRCALLLTQRFSQYQRSLMRESKQTNNAAMAITITIKHHVSSTLRKRRNGRNRGKEKRKSAEKGEKTSKRKTIDCRHMQTNPVLSS